MGLRGNDLVLVAEDGVGCVVQQVDGPFVGGANQLLSFGGTYAKSEIDSVQLASFGAGNRPSCPCSAIPPATGR